jgi:hypothetical protein
MPLTYLDFDMVEQPIEELSAKKLLINNIQVTGLTAEFVKSNYIVGETIDYFQKNFSNDDSSKAFHFDTGLVGNVIAFFPNNLNNGFNVAIMNIDSTENNGSSTIILSAETGQIYSTNFSQTNSFTNTGVFIYKYDGKLYGVGTFDA